MAGPDGGSSAAPASASAAAGSCRGQVRANITTPIETAESATLKTGQCQRPQPMSMKSTTSPVLRRSTRLPSAPPRMSASAKRRPVPWTRPRANSTRIASTAAIENR